MKRPMYFVCLLYVPEHFPKSTAVVYSFIEMYNKAILGQSPKKLSGDNTTLRIIFFHLLPSIVS